MSGVLRQGQARRIAFINEKGGTCKTTLAVNLAAYWAKEKGLATLLLDLDTQGHAGKALGLDVRSLSPNMFHFLTDQEVTIDQVARHTSVPGLMVVPAYKEMADFPSAVAGDPSPMRRLEARLKSLQPDRYQAIVFDAPPSMGLASLNILSATFEVVMPVALTYLALDGCAEMMETIRRVREELGNPSLTVLSVVPTLYRKTALADAILQKLEHYFPHTLCRTPLAFNVKIDEAQSHGKTIWEYAPKSRGAQMLEAIAEEVWSDKQQELESVRPAEAALAVSAS